MKVKNPKGQEFNLATEEYVKENLQVTALQYLPGSIKNEVVTRICGIIVFNESSVTGKSDDLQIKDWLLAVSKTYPGDDMIDVIFKGDSRSRLTGYMYHGGDYGLVVQFKFEAGQILHNRSEGKWI